MRYKTQDPKFDIEVNINGAQLVNGFTGDPIPDDEPIFIFRAKDFHALSALGFYLTLCADPFHCEVVKKRMDEFESFATSKKDRMKEPDTTLNT